MAAMLATFALTGCDSEVVDPVTKAEVRGPYDQKGVFILNEGNFGTPSGSVSFLSDSAGHTVKNDIFKKANADRPLGDVLQDMAIYEDRAFIVANNSNKLEIVNAYTFKTTHVIALKQPRYVAVLNKEKAYVTEWVKYGEPGQVSVIDLNTNTVVKTIATGPMPEQLKIANGKLYVAVSGANQVLVINTATDTIEKAILTPDSPSELETDLRNNLWILSAGNVVYNPDYSTDYSKTTPGALSMLNTVTDFISTTYTFPSNQSIPGNLTINGSKNKLYFTYQGKTYVQPSNANTLSNTVFINRSFYGLDVDPDTDIIYGSDNNGFAGEGTVMVYNADGTKLHEFKAGIGPNKFVFN